MWRYSLLLLIVLPLIVILLNQGTLSAILMIVWIALVIPVCILHAVDYLKRPRPQQIPWIRNLIRIPIFLLGLLSFVMGACIVLWCLYNVFIHRTPEYSGPGSTLGLLLSGFGVAPQLMALGWYWMRLAIGNSSEKYRTRNIVFLEEPEDEE